MRGGDKFLFTQKESTGGQQISTVSIAKLMPFFLPIDKNKTNKRFKNQLSVNY